MWSLSSADGLRGDRDGGLNLREVSAQECLRHLTSGCWTKATANGRIELIDGPRLCALTRRHLGDGGELLGAGQPGRTVVPGGPSGSFAVLRPARSSRPVIQFGHQRPLGASWRHGSSHTQTRRIAAVWPSTWTPLRAARDSSASGQLIPWAMPLLACPSGKSADHRPVGARWVHQPGKRLAAVFDGSVSRTR